MAYDPLSPVTRRIRGRLLGFASAGLFTEIFSISLKDIETTGVELEFDAALLPWALAVLIVYHLMAFGVHFYDDMLNTEKPPLQERFESERRDKESQIRRLLGSQLVLRLYEALKEIGVSSERMSADDDAIKSAVDAMLQDNEGDDNIDSLASRIMQDYSLATQQKVVERIGGVILAVGNENSAFRLEFQHGDNDLFSPITKYSKWRKFRLVVYEFSLPLTLGFISLAAIVGWLPDFR